MFSSSNTPRKPAEQHRTAETSLIAAGTSITGDVHFSGALHLDGRIEGSVQAEDESQAVFTLSAEGEVAGEIRVPNAVINGTVRGDIYAAERLELAAQARVDGDVHYRVLEMAAGAEVNGRMVHEGSQPQRRLTGPDEAAEENGDAVVAEADHA
ncbi:MAG TPA: polymer-forming cytoskeletal protein [Rhodanobacteraceae bacterium]